MKDEIRELLHDCWQQLFDRDAESIDTQELLDRIDDASGKRKMNWREFNGLE